MSIKLISNHSHPQHLRKIFVNVLINTYLLEIYGPATQFVIFLKFKQKVDRNVNMFKVVQGGFHILINLKSLDFCV